MKKLLLAVLSLVLCGFLAIETITPINAQTSSATISAKKTEKKKKKAKKSKKTSKKSKKKKKKTTAIDTSTPEGKIAQIIQDKYSRDIKDPNIEFDGVNTYFVTYEYNLSSMTTTHISQVVSDYVDVCRSAYENEDINSIEFDVKTPMSDGSSQVVLMFCSSKDTFMQTDLTDFLISNYWDTFSNSCTNAWISPNIKDKVDTSSITYVN